MDHLNLSIVTFQREGEMVDTIARFDLVEQALRVVHILRCTVEIAVYLLKKLEIFHVYDNG